MNYGPAGAGSRPEEAGAGSAAASMVGSGEASSEGVGADSLEKREVVLALKADTDFIQSMEVGALHFLLLPLLQLLVGPVSRLCLAPGLCHAAC